ncbi:MULTISPECIES: hypothetical protein [unclassified Rhodosalinus]|uniref:hypothetical protein n=1 Tax=unclassified Rhodosalinus TaxID=2630183 RepID=UPI0035267660
MNRHVFLIAATAALAATAAAADPAVIEGARAEPDGAGWRISVTLRHGDTGWDDYADAWRVLGPSGEVLATRELLHPHVTEQPFTRSLAGITLPEGMTELRIEASTSVTGWGGELYLLELPTE